MRFGLPSLALLVAALAISCSRIAMQSTLTRRERDYRTGYLITLAGLTVTLGTLYIWTATSVFVWIYIGAGAWFYMRDTAESTTETEARVRARRAAQARGFGSVRRPSRPPPRRGRRQRGGAAPAEAARRPRLRGP